MTVPDALLGKACWVCSVLAHAALTGRAMCKLQAYSLIQPKELAPLQELIGQMLSA